MRLGTPRLDFVVIGAQKAGTTSLWRYLDDHPRLRMPPAKEAPFFVSPSYPDELRRFMRALFKDAPRRAKLGTVSPDYMLGVPGVSVPEVARRIASCFPDARLIALLRDPVARARSSHRMMSARGGDSRTFAEAVVEQLEPANLQRARAGVEPAASYVAGGEYGRMLAAYLERFPRDRVHVELSADLEGEPAAVIDRVCTFIGVEPHAPRHLGKRFHVSGRRRVSEAAEAELKEYLARHVWPRMRHPLQHRHTFENWFQLWNVEPEPVAAPPDDTAAARLREHYAEDARTLEAVTGLRAPWAG